VQRESQRTSRESKNSEPREAAPPDPEPWGHRARPGERPRHESAEPEDPDDPTETSAAIDAESWGEIVEVAAGDTVDGDFNGAPELAGIEHARARDGADVLDVMEGRDARAQRDDEAPSGEERIEDLIADRRQVLIERLDEARELDLGSLFESVIAASARKSGEMPIVSDPDALRACLARLEDAIEELETRSAGSGGAPPPRAR
jgi:hypothetical protein